MQTYYHTFGIGHPNAQKVQLIIAENNTDALRAMFKKYGNRWAFQYTEKQWHADPMNKKRLKTIKVPSTKKYMEHCIG